MSTGNLASPPAHRGSRRRCWSRSRFALGFAEFVLIGITARRGRGAGRAAHARRRPRGLLRARLRRRHACRRARHGARRPLQGDGGAAGGVQAPATCSRCSPTITRCCSSRACCPPPHQARFWPLALTYVPDIVAKERVAAVLGLVLAGFSVSSVVGVPIGTALADMLGWKAAYACVFALGLAVSAALLPALPRGSSAHAAGAAPTLRSQLRLLGDARVLGAAAMILAGVASTYVFYTLSRAHPRRRRRPRRARREPRAAAVRASRAWVRTCCRDGVADRFRAARAARRLRHARGLAGAFGREPSRRG